MVAGQRLENRHVRVSPREMRGLMQGERLQAPDTPSIVPLGKFQDTNAKAELLIISRWQQEIINPSARPFSLHAFKAIFGHIHIPTWNFGDLRNCDFH